MGSVVAGKQPEVTATLENYLEAISRITLEKGVARVRDIATALSVHKSTVTAALKSLAEKGLVNYEPYEVTTLTARGRRVALEVARRHEVIRRFLREVLLADNEAAEANACRMEHVMDKDILHRLSLFAEFVKECPRTGEDWLQRFSDYYEHNGHLQPDAAEIERYRADIKKRMDEGKAGEGSEEQC